MAWLLTHASSLDCEKQRMEFTHTLLNLSDSESLFLSPFLLPFSHYLSLSPIFSPSLDVSLSSVCLWDEACNADLILV